MNVLFLYSEAMDYTLATLKELIAIYHVTVHLVHWDKKKNTPFKFAEVDKNFYCYKRSELNKKGLKRLVDTLNPVLIYCSGRMDRDYLVTCLYAKKKGIPTVSGFDTQWQGNWKDILKSIFSYPLYRRYFDWAWVAGIYQYEFVRKIGFKKNKIIFGLCSANTQKLNFTANYNKRFVFVGRFVEHKGIKQLYQAFLETYKYHEHNWELHFIGNGPLKSQIPSHDKIKVIDFLQPDELHANMKIGGVFVLPSFHEPWGVVVHEFACVGYPIICSNAVGSAVHFVINGYNGFVYDTYDRTKLVHCLNYFITCSERKWYQMSQNSVNLSKSLNSTISAIQLGSILFRI